MGRRIFQDNVKMKSIKQCEVCGSNNIKSLFKQYDKNLNIKKYFYISKCKNCLASFLNPQPEYKELEEHYLKDKYYSLKNIETKESKKTRLKLKLYNIYFNSNRNNLLLKTIFSPIKFIVRGTNLTKGNKLLDVGCGSGQFLYEMKELGMDVQGVEPGELNEEENKKYSLNIKKSNLIDAKYKKESFDLITINHVLEHLDNPNETLNEINKILKKDGKLILAIPNTSSLAYWIFKKNWYQLDVPRHIINYSNKNIKLILEKNGFKIKRTRYNSRPSQFVVSLYFSFNIKKRIKPLNYALDILFLPLTWLVNFLRMGDQIEVWCEKK